MAYESAFPSMWREHNKVVLPWPVKESMGEIREWLNDDARTGLWCVYHSSDRQVSQFGFSDPDLAFEFKMRFYGALA